VILHMVTRVQPDVPVVWMDNGYNTEATYFADEVTAARAEPQDLPAAALTRPPRGRGRRHARAGRPRHAAFTQEVKLEPFARALRETAPQVWFTALRATDTAVRAQMEPSASTPTG
jgi:phosphoadenosine phosphosulfate reductase